jgi:excisionase family DNA binding protein
MAAEITTQKAAEILGCSRPHLIKLLEQGKIEFTKIGKHRRIKFEHLMAYHKQMKDEQKKNLIALMNHDEENGLYDS